MEHARRSFPPGAVQLDARRGYALIAIDETKLLLEGKVLRCVRHAPPLAELWRLELPVDCEVEGEAI